MAEKSKFTRPSISIVGVGLIGGSLGQALKRGRLVRSVTGVGRRTAQIKLARKLRVIDKGTTDLAQGVKTADIVFLCASPTEIIRLARQAMPYLKPWAILTDVGSIKTDIVQKIERFKRRDISFVGGHPIAGSERCGVSAARPDLFKGATWILTRSKGASDRSRTRLKKLLSSICGKVQLMTPQEHDRVLAFTSHLPHAVAAMLIHLVCPEYRLGIGTGFKDTTRIASGDPSLWSEIFIENRAELTRSIRQMKEQLGFLEKQIQKKPKKDILRYLAQAKKWRDRI